MMKTRTRTRRVRHSSKPSSTTKVGTHPVAEQQPHSLRRALPCHHVQRRVLLLALVAVVLQLGIGAVFPQELHGMQVGHPTARRHRIKRCKVLSMQNLELSPRTRKNDAACLGGHMHGSPGWRPHRAAAGAPWPASATLYSTQTSPKVSHRNGEKKQRSG